MPAVTNKLATLPTNALNPIKSVLIVPKVTTSHTKMKHTTKSIKKPIKVTDTKKNALLECPLLTCMSNFRYFITLLKILKVLCFILFL